MSESRKVNLLARSRILESFGGSRRVANSTIRLPIVRVSSEVPSNVMLRSLEHAPTSRQKDDDALESMNSASSNAKVWVYIHQSCLVLTSINSKDLAQAFTSSFSDWLAVDSMRNARNARRMRPTTSFVSPLPSGNRRGIPALISSIDSKIPLAQQLRTATSRRS